MGATLNKSAIVLKLDETEEALAEHGRYFVPKDEVGEHFLDQEEFYLPIQKWKDMGEPTEITITIVPGNTLNTEETATSNSI